MGCGECKEILIGSPAHAGIDPGDADMWHGSERFPRTRGDRPTGCESSEYPSAVPPHTRG